MLCPFCLEDVRPQHVRAEGPFAYSYACPKCREAIPALHVRDYRRYPPVVVSVVGFQRHGKTLFVASLFYTMLKLKVASYWPGFYMLPLNEESLEVVYELVRTLERGELPPSTPKLFPRPTVVRVEEVPLRDRCTLLFYDTAGESFEKASQLGRYASFVRRARTALFLVSLPRIREDGSDVAVEMEKLLAAYIQAMGALGEARRQHLVVVYTCGDELEPFLEGWPDLLQYLVDGSVDTLADRQRYVLRMRQVSDRLADFTERALDARPFLNLARKSFRSVHFSVVSALGAAPQDGRLPARIAPRRILDPLFWMMEQALPPWKQTWHAWQAKLRPPRSA
jgi:hypothetical protein